MEVLIPLIAIAVVSLPVLAFILAAVALNKSRKAEQASERLEHLSARLQKLEERVRRAGGAAASPATDGGAPAPQTEAEPSADGEEEVQLLEPEPQDATKRGSERSRDADGQETSVDAVAPADETLAATVPSSATTKGPPESPPPPEAPPPPGSPPSGAAGEPPREPDGEAATSWEERLGSKLPVWAGSIALTLAGAFLVKYSVDQGLLSPAVRVTLGFLFGAVLLVLGEVLRSRASLIAQGLSAAGVAVNYAVLLAAVNLYELIPPSLGFAVMALNTAVAVGLSLRQGPLVAMLGIVGGFVSPAFLQAGSPLPAFLGYLFLLEVAMVVVTRSRHWWVLTALTLLGGMGWAGAWLVWMFEPHHSIWLGLFLLGSVALFIFGSIRHDTDDEVEGAWAAWTWLGRWLGIAAGAVGTLLIGGLVGAADFGVVEWGFLGILGAASLVLGRIEGRYEPLAWLTAVTSLVLMVAWTESPSVTTARLGWTALAFGAVYGIGGYACLWGARSPARWASLSALAVVAFLLLAYREIGDDLTTVWSWQPAGGEEGDVAGTWGGICLMVAALYTTFAVPVARRRASGGSAVSLDGALAAVATAVTGFVALAVPIELEREWITVAWALQVPAVAWIGGTLQVRALRIVAGVLTAMVAARLLLNPAVLTYPTGEHLVLNWLWYGYGIPILALAAGAWRLARDEDDVLVKTVEFVVVALGFVLLALLVRQYFHPGDLDASSYPLVEWASFPVVWLVEAIALLAAARKWPRLSLLAGGLVVGGIALAAFVLGVGIGQNPLWAHHAVGETVIFNRLLYVYGLPALLLLGLWQAMPRDTEAGSGDRVIEAVRSLRPHIARALGLTVLATVLLLVTLEVRQAWQGTYLDGPAPENAELYTYSAAWIVFGTLLLIAGIVRGGKLLRYASLVVMLMAVGKVFLYDMRQLQDLYRVFSFLGLGASLLLLAYLYQRFVFRKPA